MSGVKGMRHGIRKREDNITNRRIRRTKIIGNTKECSVCKEFKGFEEFVKTQNTKSGLAALCKECNYLHVIEWKQKQDPIKEKLRHNAVSKKWVEDLKFEVISHYGVCYCCGEDRLPFLTIDHINGGGYQHRKEIGMLGYRFYVWLRNNNYPEEFRTACANCNMAIRYGNICPHKAEENI